MIKRKITIKKRFLSLSLTLIFLIFIIGFIPFNLNKFYKDKINLFSNLIIPSIENLTLADMMHDGIRANEFGLIMANDSRDFDRVKELVQEQKEFTENFLKYLQNLKNVTKKETILSQLDLIIVDANTYVELSNNISKFAYEKKYKEVHTLVPKFNEIFKKLEGSMESLRGEVKKYAVENEKAVNEYSQNIMTINLALLCISLFVGIFVSILIINGLSKILNKLIVRLANQMEVLIKGSNNLKINSTEISDMTLKQAAAIEETASSMEEMSSMLTQTSKHSVHNMAVAEEGQICALKGKEAIIQMLSAIDSIQASNTKLEDISALITKIANKTKIINEIVSETRLLSFNASIEAARAGVHGKGFAVVAEEVGKLASMSGTSASEIRELLESSTLEVAHVVTDIRERINSGKNIFKECETAFDSMTEVLKKINDGTKIIVTSTKEQELGVKQTSTAMVQMDLVIKRNSSISEQQAKDAVNLSNGIKNIEDIISDLKSLIIGNKTTNLITKEDENLNENSNVVKNIKLMSTQDKDGLPENDKNTNESVQDIPSRNDSRWKA